MQVQGNPAITSFRFPVFVQPGTSRTDGQPAVIDDLTVLPDGVAVGQFSRETIEQLGRRYPGVYIDEMDTVMEQKRTLYRRQFDVIDEDGFMQALEALPPVGWSRADGVESFKMSERIFDNITAIYCRLKSLSGDRFFRFNDDINMSASAVAERLKREIAVSKSVKGLDT